MLGGIVTLGAGADDYVLPEDQQPERATYRGNMLHLSTVYCERRPAAGPTAQAKAASKTVEILCHGAINMVMFGRPELSCLIGPGVQSKRTSRVSVS
jgi:hypothetical protein